MKNKITRILVVTLLTALLISAISHTAFASGDVASAVENTWTTAKGQIKSIVDMLDGRFV